MTLTNFSSFCTQMDESVLVSEAERMAKDVGPFLLLTNEDTLSLVLETLSSIVRINNGVWMNPDLAESLVTAMLQVWVNNNKGELLSLRGSRACR